MFYVYVLENKNGSHYIGQTENLETRLDWHNNGLVRSTKNKRPWKILYTESFDNRKSAVLRERQLKRYKGGEAFKRLIRK